MTYKILAIGNFDGMHQGHQALLRQGTSLALQKNGVFEVLTFSPHPKQFFEPNSSPFLLISLSQRTDLLKQHGASHVWVEQFNNVFATLSAQDFIQQVLIKKMGATSILVGSDFKFGNNRAGDVALLQAAGLDVPHMVLEKNNNQPISSTRIRQALQQGDVEQANQLLGWAWAVQGVVQHGAQLARTLGFPTANIAWPAEMLVPKLGVYAGFALLPSGQKLAAIANIGTRPTVNAQADSAQDVYCEVHILNFNDNLYGIKLGFELGYFIRPEKKFDGLESLKTQIMQDIAYAREQTKTSTQP